MKKVILLFFTFILSVSVFGADEYKFRTLSPYGGLSTDGVKSVCQDKEGFTWVIVNDEIFRFDGFNFKKYSGKLKDNQENTAVSYRSLYVDSEGNLYLSTSVGVFLYRKKLDSFVLWQSDPVTKIIEDYYGNLWLVDKGISIYNKEKRGLIGFYSANKESEDHNNVLFADKSGNVFFSTEFGKVAMVKGKSREIDYLYSFPDRIKIISMHLLGNHLWVLSERKGLFAVDIKNKAVVKKYDFFLQDKENVTPAKCLFVDQNNIIWIGTQQGLYAFNPQTEENRLFLQDSEKPFTIVNNSIWTITGDDAGNMWIGTYSGGLSYLSPYDKNGISNVSLKSYGFSQKAVSSFAEINGNVWFGTEGGGLYCYDESKKKIKGYFHESNNKNSLRYNNVKTLLWQDNFLWIGMYRGGIDRLDLNTGKFKNYGEKDPEKRILSDEVVKFEAERDSGMWVIYQRYGKILTFFSFTDNTSHHYFLETEEDNHPQTNEVTMIDISRGDGNDLWLASSSSIFRFNTKERRCKNINRLSGQVGSNGNINIKTIYYDKHRSCLWIGTRNHGLAQYDVKTKEIKFHDSILKIEKTAINSIKSDKKGNLWLGSETGLFYFDVGNNSFYRYDKNDGLQSPVFYPRSVFKSSNGTIYFGGTEGFNYFDPQRITTNRLKPKILLVDFLANSKSIGDDVGLLTDFVSNSKIRLSYNQNDIGFELSSTNYLMPTKNRYKYRLKGYSDEWTEVDASRRYVSYSKLPSGKYVFEAQAANNSGVWGDIQRFGIDIKPAPWNTTFAYIIYFILISISMYLIHKEKIRRDNLKNEIYLAERRKRDQEENHQAQLRFFTNITHDFKTPLTLMLGTLDYIEHEKYKIPPYYLKSLKTNSSRLLQLVNEVIDFRTVENGIMRLKLDNINFNNLIYDLASNMRDYAYHKDIKLKIVTTPTLLNSIIVDLKVVEKIVINLLDNALKYTPKKGLVTIETYQDIFSYKTIYSYSYAEGLVSNEKEMFGFVVRDTGVGISEESISKVFNRFYRVEDNDNDSHLGSGIGLALVKSLILLHDGFITIASERGIGTDIIVGFPLINIQHTDEIEYEEINEIISDNKEYVTIPELKHTKQTHNILYVEDNKSIKQLVSSFLIPNFDLTFASNGEEALSLIKKQNFDLILSDWMMPVMDGISLCKRVKNNPEFSHIPFILMTVRSGVENQLEGFGAGAEAYLEKPINFQLLQKTIFNLLQLRDNFRIHFADNYFIDTKESTLNKTTNETLNKFIDIVQRRITEQEVDLDEIALEMNMSRRKLFSFIKDNTGKSIVEFIRSFKIRLAARLIVEEGLTIKEVMPRVSIESQSYFSKAFKDEFGESPSAFLAKIRNKKIQN